MTCCWPTVPRSWSGCVTGCGSPTATRRECARRPANGPPCAPRYGRTRCALAASPDAAFPPVAKCESCALLHGVDRDPTTSRTKSMTTFEPPTPAYPAGFYFASAESPWRPVQAPTMTAFRGVRGTRPQARGTPHGASFHSGSHPPSALPVVAVPRFRNSVMVLTPPRHV